MTGQEVITKFTEMVDDELSDDLMLQLLNDAKDEIESLQIWEQLKAVDSSRTETTASIALPTRFALPIKLYVGTETDPYTNVPMEDARFYQNDSRAFYIDLANSVYYLLGTRASSNTIYFYHTKYSADIALATSWAFPSRFHSILPLKMAQLYYAIDAGDKARAWDDRWTKYYNEKLDQMTAWNDLLKARANRRTVGLHRTYPERGLIL